LKSYAGSIAVVVNNIIFFTDNALDVNYFDIYYLNLEDKVTPSQFTGRLEVKNRL
jgi:hypothetical protein